MNQKHVLLCYLLRCESFTISFQSAIELSSKLRRRSKSNPLTLEEDSGWKKKMPEHTKDKQTRKDSGQQIFYDGLKIKCGHWNT